MATKTTKDACSGFNCPSCPQKVGQILLDYYFFALILLSLPLCLVVQAGIPKNCSTPVSNIAIQQH